ncbi:hypothetical protein VPHK389_0104 [Vibrio phage K389]|nr:hypothetical protein SIPHO010v1_p0003 [Vibrio phage 268E42.1]
MKYDPKFSLVGNIKHLFKIDGASHDEQLFNIIALTKSERDHLCTSLSELSHKNEQDVCELDAYRAGNHPDLKPQLSEIRYVLHGDIQPCSVLYSDDTTTLLRLDEGDIMCETDTIEWSDSVTYRCQELLKSATSVHIAVPLKTSKLFAQLVRDERILLNDNGDDESVPTLDERTQPVVRVRKPDATDIPFMRHSLVPEHSIEQPCDECGHVFDADSMTCPMCNTIRPSKQHPTAGAQPDIPSEWTDNNSPTPLR